MKLFHEDFLNPQYFVYGIKSNELLNRLKIIGETSQIRIAELLNGNICKHCFVSHMSTLPKKESLLFSDEWINSFPILWGGAKLKVDHKGNYIDLAFRNGENVSQALPVGEVKEILTKFYINENELEFIKLCNGHKCIEEILMLENINMNIKDVKILLYKLIKKDILFLFNEIQTEYYG